MKIVYKIIPTLIAISHEYLAQLVSQPSPTYTVLQLTCPYQHITRIREYTRFT
jgi:hypothetical protein